MDNQPTQPAQPQPIILEFNTEKIIGTALPVIKSIIITVVTAVAAKAATEYFFPTPSRRGWFW